MQVRKERASRKNCKMVLGYCSCDDTSPAARPRIFLDKFAKFTCYRGQSQALAFPEPPFRRSLHVHVVRILFVCTRLMPCWHHDRLTVPCCAVYERRVWSPARRYTYAHRAKAMPECSRLPTLAFRAFSYQHIDPKRYVMAVWMPCLGCVKRGMLCAKEQGRAVCVGLAVLMGAIIYLFLSQEQIILTILPVWFCCTDFAAEAVTCNSNQNVWVCLNKECPPTFSSQ